MPKTIEEDDIFVKEPYRSIMFLLTFVPEGLEPKEILTATTDEKTLDKLKQEKKIKYDIKKVRRKLQEKINKKQTDFRDYSNYTKKDHFTPNIISNKIEVLKNLNAVYKDKNLIKITDYFLRIGNGRLFADALELFPTGHSNYSDRSRLNKKEKSLKDAYSKLFSEFSVPNEKKEFEKYLEDMKLSVEGINKKILLKVQQKWEGYLEEFCEETNSKRIKKAIEEGSPHFYQLINLPFYFIELRDKQRLTERIFYYYTGLLFISEVSRWVFTGKKLTEEMDNIERRKKQINKIFDEMEKKVTEKNVSFEEKKKLVDALNLEFTTLKDNISQSHKRRKDWQEDADKLNKIVLPYHEPISDEFEIIKKVVIKERQSYDMKRFCKVWSNYFFWKDYDFSVDDLFEIVDWCRKKVGAFRENYQRSIDLLPLESMKYINRMYMGLGKDIPFKPLKIMK